MKETQDQYVERISGYVKGKNHFKVFQGTVKKLQSILEQGERSRLLRQRQADKWSAGEILAHLAESELVLGYRLRLVLARNGATVQAFDQNQWQANAGYLVKDVRESLALFRALRESNISLLKSITKKQWNAFGIHEERGKEDIARMVELYAGHDVNHLKQIENLVKKRK